MKTITSILIILMGGGLVLSGISPVPALARSAATRITIIFTSDTVSQIWPLSC